jgi:predicted acetyltransferase
VSPADLVIRTVEEHEQSKWTETLAQGFLDRPHPGETERRFREVPCKYTWAMFDGDMMVATLRLEPSTITVPGGLAVESGRAGFGAVIPSLLRRGYYRSLLNHVLSHAKNEGLVMASGIATDHSAYRRLGWGRLAEHATFEIDRNRAALGNAHVSNAIKYLDSNEAHAVLPDIFSRAAAGRSATNPRPSAEWMSLLEPMCNPPPQIQRFCVVADDGDPAAYALYDVERRWLDSAATFVLSVEELVAERPASEISLLAHLLGLSLVERIIIKRRTVDDHLPLFFRHTQGITVHVQRDGLWGRILDLPKLLSARKYLVESDYVLEVSDPAGLVDGRWAVQARYYGAACSRTQAAADLRLDVGSLAMLVMGGCSGSALKRAGRLDTLSARGRTVAESVFFWPEGCWSPARF